MKQGFVRWVKNVAVLGSAALCLWCAAGEFQSWARREGDDALLFAAGMKAQAASSQVASPAPTATPAPDYLLPDDGVVSLAAAQEPQASVTPDPSRSYAPVEEIQLSGGAQVGNFYVKDSTGSGTDLNAALQEEPSVHLKQDGSVEILIYHTHTSEAYSQSYTGFYYTDMETRTTNQEQSVVAAGEALKQALEAAGFGVIHDTTVNDTLYNGSYDRSWEVLQKNLAEYPTIQVTIDVHRDSMTTDSGVKYKPTATIGGRKAAQVMLIAGCDADGGWGDFPRWEENLRLALRVQESLETLYPAELLQQQVQHERHPRLFAGGGGHRGEHRQRGRLCRAAGGAGPGPCAGGHCGRRVTLYTIKRRLAEKAPAGGDRPRRRGLVPCLLFLSKPLGGFLKPSASWGRTAETCLLFSPFGNPKYMPPFGVH